MSNYLVTGGAGFIGSHLVNRLVKDGHRVTVLDQLTTGKLSNMKEIRADIALIEGDLRDERTVEGALKGVDAVFHLGAVPSVPKSIVDPLTSDRVNTGGTLAVLHAAVKQGVRRVVYSASSSAYGNTNQVPKTESMTAAPESPYAISKYAGELYCRAFSRIYGLETVSLRYFNVFGPRQDPNSEYAAVIPKFIQAIRSGNAPVIYGDGTQSRDFTHVDNVVSANLLAAQAPRLQGEVVNIGCGERITLNELVEGINRLLHTGLKPRYTDWRKGDVLHSLADIRSAGALLGYAPSVPFKEGLSRTVEWFGGKGD